MNNKGFTVVELLASFALTMIIMVFLFEIVLQLKEVYVTTALRAKIYEKNVVVAATLNNKFNNVSSAVCDGVSCEINEVSEFIKIGADNKSIVIDGQTIEYPDNIDQIIPEFSTGPTIDYDGTRKFIKIEYQVKSGYLDKMVAFNFVYLLD